MDGRKGDSFEYQEATAPNLTADAGVRTPEECTFNDDNVEEVTQCLPEQNLASGSGDLIVATARQPVVDADDDTEGVIRTLADAIKCRPAREYLIAVDLLAGMHPCNPRRVNNLKAMTNFIGAVRKNDVVVPIKVVREGVEILIVDGGRRWGAAKVLGLELIPCVFITGDPAIISLRSQLQGQALKSLPLTTWELCEAVQDLSDTGLKGVELTQTVKRSKAWVSHILSIRKIPLILQRSFLQKGVPPWGLVKIAKECTTEAEMEQMAEEYLARKTTSSSPAKETITVPEALGDVPAKELAHELILRIKGANPATMPQDEHDEYKQLRDELIRIFTTPGHWRDQTKQKPDEETLSFDF